MSSFSKVTGGTMGQQDIYDFLKKNKRRWFTSKELSKKLGISIGSVTMSLKKLRESKSVKFQTTKRNMFKYMFKK
jgi:transcription initiation factor IIE alpha subunit